MAAKKERGRFTIKLNENDPAHEAVIRLLEQQPPRGKAQFVVTALLDHMSKSVAAEHIAPAINREEIEAIVLDVLRRQNVVRQDGNETQTPHPSEPNVAQMSSPEARETFNIQTPADQETMALIADTLAAFRGG